jgi:hypothetical protein
MSEQTWWQKILTNGLVWGALLAWANAVVIEAWPTAPQHIVSLTNVLIGAILAALGVKDVVVPAVKKLFAR